MKERKREREKRERENLALSTFNGVLSFPALPKGLLESHTHCRCANWARDFGGRGEENRKNERGSNGNETGRERERERGGEVLVLFSLFSFFSLLLLAAFLLLLLLSPNEEAGVFIVSITKKRRITRSKRLPFRKRFS